MMNRLPHTYSSRSVIRIRFLLSFVLLLAFYSCGNLYTGDETPVTPDEPDINPDRDKVPVMVAFCDPIYNVLTRGTGVIDPADANNYSKRMQKGLFFIYAFRRDNAGDNVYTTHRLDDVNQRYCLVDGSCDEPMMQDAANPERDKNGYPYLTPEQCKEHGKRARYAGNGSFVNWISTTNAPYYSMQQQLDPFNFFAYYYDDAKIGSVQRTIDRISFDVTVDGSQDLMCASASNLGTLIGEIEKNPDKDYGDYQELASRLKQLQPDELKTVKGYYYSTYTARFNLWPIIRMQHQMAYVKVKFRSALNGGISDFIRIKSVRLETVHKGTFTVAAYDLTKLGASFPEDGERAELVAREPSEGADGEAAWRVKTWTSDNGTLYHPKHPPVEEGEENKPTELEGGVFLAPPGNNARLIIETEYYRDGDETAEPVLGVATHDLKDIIYNKDTEGNFLTYGFMKSREYTITASVYGSQDIQINVQPASWEHGGDIDIDQDDIEKNK
nr:hypothetical protein [uncultured Bacteroides sp.]